MNQGELADGRFRVNSHHKNPLESLRATGSCLRSWAVIVLAQLCSRWFVLLTAALHNPLTLWNAEFILCKTGSEANIIWLKMLVTESNNTELGLGFPMSLKEFVL